MGDDVGKGGFGATVCAATGNEEITANTTATLKLLTGRVFIKLAKTSPPTRR